MRKTLGYFLGFNGLLLLIPSLFAAGWGAWALAYRGGEGLSWQGVAIWGSVVAFLATRIAAFTTLRGLT